MREESDEHNRPLRKGLTTGACATACTVAAACYLFSGRPINKAKITLPRGQAVDIEIVSSRILMQDKRNGTLESIQSATIKDAGDDPDVTHGALISASVKRVVATGIRFFAGEGVGIVTKAGLSLPVGEPAINPVPRAMMIQHLKTIAEQYNYSGGFEISVAIENGEAIAKKTMNARLGILGGLSILGTTGIVRPFSCSAYIASIRQGIDVAHANGLQHIAACTGSTSEAVVQKHYQLSDMAIIEMGDYVGVVVKHLNKTPIPKLTLAAGFGKLCKLADGHLNLHSSSSAIDFSQLADLASELGAQPNIHSQIEKANTSAEVLQICKAQEIPIVSVIAEKAKHVLQGKLPQTIDLDVVIVDRSGAIL